MKKQPKRTLFSVLLALAFVVLPLSHQQANAKDNFDDVFRKQFNGMWNYTQAQTNRVNGAYGASLGGMSVRTPIKNWTIVAYTPPNFKAGCGGIDAHFGSFSFISGENIQELFRSIIGNAAGYIFRLALKNVCSSCDDIMDSFAQKASDINSKAMNTCQLATSAVDWIRGEKNPKNQQSEQQQEGIEATADGSTGDLFESMGKVFRGKNGKEGGNANANRKSNAHNKDTRYGNNLLNTYVSADIFNQGRIDTAIYGSDRQFFEIAMSLIGTNIMMTGSNINKGQNNESVPDRYVEPIWTFENLVSGTPTGDELSVLSCDTFSTDSNIGAGKCQKVTTTTNTWPGVERLVIELLAGKQTTLKESTPNAYGNNQVITIQPNSIVAYLRDTQSVTLSEAQENFLSGMPPAYRIALTQAAQSKHQDITRATTAVAAKYLSRQIAAGLAKAIVQTTRQSYNTVLTNKEMAQMSPKQVEALNKLEQEVQKVEIDSNKHAQEFLASVEHILNAQRALENNATKHNDK